MGIAFAKEAHMAVATVVARAPFTIAIPRPACFLEGWIARRATVLQLQTRATPLARPWEGAE